MTTYFTAKEISAEIKTRLSAIRNVGGSQTDIGAKVMMGRRKIPADDELPCITVLEGLDDVKDQPGRIPSVLIGQQYIVNGFAPCDPDNPNETALAMIEDIKAAIFKGPEGTTWNGKVKRVVYMGRDIGPRPDGAGFVQCQVLFSVEYVEALTPQ